MIRQGKILAPFTTTGRHAPVAAEDQARVIVAILQNPTAHAGKTYPLFGPVELTLPEVAAIISRVIGKEVTYQQVRGNLQRTPEETRSKHRDRHVQRSRCTYRWLGENIPDAPSS